MLRKFKKLKKSAALSVRKRLGKDGRTREPDDPHPQPSEGPDEPNASAGPPPSHNRYHEYRPSADSLPLSTVTLPPASTRPASTSATPKDAPPSPNHPSSLPSLMLRCNGHTHRHGGAEAPVLLAPLDVGYSSHGAHIIADLWDEALRRYRDVAGVDLSDEESDLCKRLTGLADYQAVVNVLDDIGREFDLYRHPHPQSIGTKIRGALRTIARVVLSTGVIEAIGEVAAALAVPGGKAIFVAIGVLLQATKGMSDRLDAVIGILKKFESYMTRLDVRAVSPLTLASRDLVVKILVEMLDSLALVTQMMKQNRAEHFLSVLSSKNVAIMAASQRFEDLENEEHLLILTEVQRDLHKLSSFLWDAVVCLETTMTRVEGKVTKVSQDVAVMSTAMQSMGVYDLLGHILEMRAFLGQWQARLDGNRELQPAWNVTSTHGDVHPGHGRTVNLWHATITLTARNAKSSLEALVDNLLSCFHDATPADLARLRHMLYSIAAAAVSVSVGGDLDNIWYAILTDPRAFLAAFLPMASACVTWFFFRSRICSLGLPKIPRAPEYSRSETIIIVDVLGLHMLLPLGNFQTWENVHELLLDQFENKPGERYVRSGSYTLMNTVTETTTSIIQPSSWAQSVRPGMTLEMSIVIRQFARKLECPYCRTCSPDAPDDGLIQCTGCPRKYWATRNSDTDIEDNVLEGPGSQDISSDIVFTPLQAPDTSLQNTSLPSRSDEEGGSSFSAGDRTEISNEHPVEPLLTDANSNHIIPEPEGLDPEVDAEPEPEPEHNLDRFRSISIRHFPTETEPWSTPAFDSFGIDGHASELHALIIGIDEYESDYIDNLSGAVFDADSMYNYLRTELHVPERQIVNLRNMDATRHAIIRNIQAFAMWATIRDGGPILIYFAGHGSASAAPEGWNVGTRPISLIVPHDATGWLDDNPDDLVTHAIPDRTIGALLHDLAEGKSKISDNITVIFDCSHSDSGTRGSSRSPLLRPRSVRTRRILPDVDRHIWSTGLQGRSMRAAVGFARAGVRSHVLLAACRETETAYEGENRGLFTHALITTLKRIPTDRTTYRELIKHIPAIPSQDPQCEGLYVERPLFNALVPCSWPTLYGVKIVEENNCVSISAGVMHGVTSDSEFTLYRSSRHQAAGAALARLKLGTTSKVEAFSTTLPPHPALPYEKQPYFASFESGGRDGALFFHYSPFDAGADTIESALKLAAQYQLRHGGGTIIVIDKEEDAHLTVRTTGGRAVYTSKDSLITSLVPSLLFGTTSVDPESIRRVLTGAAHFFSRLLRSTAWRELSTKVDVRFHKLKEDTDGEPESGRRRPWIIDGNVSLFDQGSVEVVADGDTPYGIALHNHSDYPLHVWAFYFNCSTLSISPYHTPPVIGQRGPEPSLPEYGDLTIGYGAGGGTPCTFTLEKTQDVDVGFIKFFISSEAVDLSRFEQASPFAPPTCKACAAFDIPLMQ
ncbi:unnamed protein product [Peniophora sp. CBMAI 1063]|nr:unnamed protein product [Peniophora sp. CBMAI 1063]